MITLVNLKLNNFKGQKNLEIDFNQDITNIYGTNEVGKTSLYDAFLWCLFGKDSAGTTNFQLKPTYTTRTIKAYNADASKCTIGQEIPKLANSVTVTLMVDGRKTVFQRTQKEKWVTKRGESVPVFTGHDIEYMVDDVAIPMKDFNKKVADIIDEEVFRMVTSVTHFNSLRWDKRREILFSMVDDVSYEDVAQGNEKFSKLLEQLNGKDLEAFKAEIKQKIKRTKDAMKVIPDLINENTRNMPERVDAKSVETQVKSLEKELSDLDAQIDSVIEANKAEQKKRLEYQQQINGIENDKLAYRYGLDQEYNASIRAYHDNRQKLETAYQKAVNTKRNAELTVTQNAERLEKGKAGMDEMRAKYNEVKAEQFTFDGETVCPTCKQDLPAGDIEKQKQDMLENFNESKAKRLAEINKDGKNLKAKVQEYEQELERATAVVKEAEKAVLNAKADLDAIGEEPTKPELTETQLEKLAEYDKKIADLQVLIEADTATDTAELRKQRNTVQESINEVKGRLRVNEQADKLTARNEELADDEKRYAQTIADLEKMEFNIQEFTKARIDMIEERINSLFNHVQFRMFDQQINEGLKETCVTLVDGVPYPDANHAGKINAGLDIVNVLSKHHKVQAPVFIDNAESIVEIIPTESQLIRLIVDEKYKTLHVE